MRDSINMIEVRPQNLKRHLGHLIRRAQQVHYALWTMRVSGEITSPQFAVLSELLAQPNIDQRTLGERVALGKSTLADVVSRLARRGLVRRVRDSRDHRRDVLRLTPKGVRTLETLTPRAIRMNRLLASMLTPAEQHQLIRLLNRVVDKEARLKNRSC